MKLFIEVESPTRSPLEKILELVQNGAELAQVSGGHVVVTAAKIVHDDGGYTVHLVSADKLYGQIER